LLFDLIERRDEVVIVQDGREIARLAPATAPCHRTQGRAALKRIRERAELLRRGRFEWPEWKAYRDEGRA
jgi:antitoxin (DNA-binding transcriptional repressor) of toxin-antitoxin stability system